MKMDDKKRLRSTEREAMMRMALAEDMLLKNRRDLDSRLMTVPRGHNKIGVICGLIRNLNAALYGTMPEDQLRQLMRNVKSKGYTIGSMMPGREEHNDEFGLWLSYDTINTLVSALKDHCLMCDKDINGQRGCKLQKALDLVGNDLPDSAYGCKYRGVI